MSEANDSWIDPVLKNEMDSIANLLHPFNVVGKENFREGFRSALAIIKYDSLQSQLAEKDKEIAESKRETVIAINQHADALKEIERLKGQPSIESKAGAMPIELVNRRDKLLNEEIAKLLSENKLLREGLEFYADHKDITAVEFAHPKMKGRNDPEIGHFVNPNDFEYIDSELAIVYGKHAREVLGKVRGK